MSSIAKVRHVSTPSDKPSLLANANDFGTRSDGKKLLMWSTRSADTKRDGTPRSSDEILEPESPEDKNFSPSSVYKDKKSITLYAIWTDSRSIVKLDANGGEFADGTTTKEFIKNYGIPYTIGYEDDPESITYGLKRVGYSFVGWSTKKYGENDRIDNPNSFMIGGDEYTTEGASTLYAVWGSEHISVKYFLNESYIAKKVEERDDGGQFNGVASFYPGDFKAAYLTLSDQSKGVTINRPPTLEGCNFIGWSTKPEPKDATDILYSAYDYDDNGAGLKYTGKEDLNLYAIWEEKTYKYDFDLSKSSDDEGIPLNINAETNFSDFQSRHESHTKYYYTPIITKT